MNDGYAAFLESKLRIAQPAGFEPGELCPMLFDWQADICRWACRGGRIGAFLDTGLGKTPLQLAWAEEIVRRFGNVLILAPLAVAQQTYREAEKFSIGVDVNVCREPNDVKPGICVINYERLHKFDVSGFVGVVLDESGILKSFAGKTRNVLIDTFRNFRFKLCCSATPAPNDHMELGNHSEFLDVMPRMEMLSNFFVHDSGETQKWRLKGHAFGDFWKWISSWAVAVTHPRDLGYEDKRFDLPALNREIHVVSCDDCPPPSGFLFHTGGVSATNIHNVKRKTAGVRADKVAELLGEADDEPWIVWCDTNYEADELTRRIPDAIEIRGNDSIEVKEERLLAFGSGELKRLITKPEIAGHGLNWQHCNRMAFIGMSFSFERTYQAVRRCWRFGQSRSVQVHMVTSDAEGHVLKTLQAKEGAFADMQTGLRDAIREHQLQSVYGTHELRRHVGSKQIRIPEWLKSHK